VNFISTNTKVYCNKNVDIKCSALDSFLQYPSSGTYKIKRLEGQIIKKCLGSIKPKGLNIIAKMC